MSKPRKYKPGESKLDLMLEKAIPSQLPVIATRASYQRMMRHCISQDVNLGELWACSKSGAKVNAFMVLQNVWNRETNKLEHFRVPIVHLYCSGCDKKPQIAGGDPIYSDCLMTLSL